MESNVQYAWGEDETMPIEGVVDVLGTITTDEWEDLIECVHNKIKKEYKDDETCRFYSRLLGKLLILANQ